MHAPPRVVIHAILGAVRGWLWTFCAARRGAAVVLLALLTACTFESEPIPGRGADRELQSAGAGTVAKPPQGGTGGTAATMDSVQAGRVSSASPSDTPEVVDAGAVMVVKPPVADASMDDSKCDVPVCDDATSCDVTCPPGCECEVPCAGLDSCNASCGVDGDCGIDCTEADQCQVQCGEGSTCNVSCLDANDCFLDCAAGASCFFDCNGTDDCEPTCAAGSTCEAECDGADNCDEVVCEEGASCLLDCAGNNDCEFSDCAAGEVECDGDIRVCGRPCP